MKIFHGTDNANILRGTVLTLGVFDGLHLGHQRIMQTVVESAKINKAVPTVITFDPHPRAVLHPDNSPPLLQTLDQRLAILKFSASNRQLSFVSTKILPVRARKLFCTTSFTNACKRGKFFSAKALRSAKIAAEISNCSKE